MKCREMEALLVELADGTITADDRKRAEMHVSACAACAADAVMLRGTFDALRGETAVRPPAHYFTNLLPTIRLRLERENRPWHIAAPLWLNTFLAPLTVTVMAVTVMGLFHLFEPTEEFSPLNSIVGQVSTEDIVALISADSDTFDSDGGSSGNGKILDMLPNAVNVAEKMKVEYLANEFPVQQTDVTILNDDTMLEEMDDDAVSQVLNRMNTGSTL